MKNRMAALLACLMLLSVPLCISAHGIAQANEYKPKAYAENITYYGREGLSKLENGELLVYLYDCFYECVETTAGNFSVYDGEHPVTLLDLATAFIAWRFDHAEQFWATNSFKYSQNEDTILAISPKYTLTGEELDTARQTFEETIQEILSGIKEGMTDFEKELYIHDYLAEKNKYVLDADHAYDAYGGIVEGQVVCEGYAEAFQTLLHRVGINSYIADGVSKNTGLPHGWNVVEIDGKWYHTDLTWNDGDTYVCHSHFNVPTEVIEIDHTIKARSYAAPVCDSYDANYYKILGGFVEEYTVDSIYSILSENGMKADLFFPDGTDEFILWLEENTSALADMAGINGEASFARVESGNGLFLSMYADDADFLELSLNVTDNLSDVQSCEITLGDYADVVGYYAGKNPIYYKNEYVCPDNEENQSIALEIDDSCKLFFTTKRDDESLSLTYKLEFVKTVLDANGGEEIPFVLQCTLTPSFELPAMERPCYKHLGWSADKDATVPQYAAKQEYSSLEDSVLYAVWEEDVEAHKYSDEWYSDEGGHWRECVCGSKIDDAPHLYDNDRDAICNDCGYTRILAGDVDGDSDVDTDDAIYLLRHTLLPGQYPVSQNVDYDGNSAVETDDAIYLLRHTLLPSEYPLYAGATDN